MSHKRNAFIFILSLLFLSTFGQLLSPEYFYRNMNSDERKRFNMQDDQEERILMGPSTISDILPKERDLTIFAEFLRKYEDSADLISNPDESVTIFAPTNSVFRQLTQKPNHVTDKSEDPLEKLHQFVLGHIVLSAYPLLPDGEKLDTLKKTTIKVERNKDGSFKLNGRVNTISSLKAVNGMVYKIDGVLD